MHFNCFICMNLQNDPVRRYKKKTNSTSISTCCVPLCTWTMHINTYMKNFHTSVAFWITYSAPISVNPLATQQSIKYIIYSINHWTPTVLGPSRDNIYIILYQDAWPNFTMFGTTTTFFPSKHSLKVRWTSGILYQIAAIASIHIPNMLIQDN